MQIHHNSNLSAPPEDDDYNQAITMDQNLKDISHPESSLFKTASIAVWRPKENGKGIDFMMGLEKQSNTLSFFGGKKDSNDKTPIDTAIREFNEETGNKLDNDTLAQVYIHININIAIRKCDANSNFGLKTCENF